MSEGNLLCFNTTETRYKGSKTQDVSLFFHVLSTIPQCHPEYAVCDIMVTSFPEVVSRGRAREWGRASRSKMADSTKIQEEKSADVYPYKDDFDVSKSTSAPVSGRSSMDVYRSGDFQGRSMTVPERIVLNGTFDSQAGNHSELARDLKGNGMDFETYMGGMVTPPRTLTVDDTSFVGEEEEILKNTEKTHAASDRLYQDTTDVNKDVQFQLQTEIVRLNNRVTWLERKLDERQSSGYWRVTLVCLLTFINPLVIHWLFNKRRY